MKIQEAKSIFTSDGLLKEEVISNSKPIIKGTDIKNEKLIETLTKDGSKMSDWAKFETPSVNSPSGEFKVHYYLNEKTGKLFYDLDYKSVFNHQGNW